MVIILILYLSQELILIKIDLNFVNRFNLQDKEYLKAELTEIYSALINGLVEGIVKEADKRNCKNGQYTYSMESLKVGGNKSRSRDNKYDSSGYILYVPHQIVYPGNTEFPYLLSIVNVVFARTAS